MWTLGIMLTRMLAMRFIGILLGISVFVLSLEVVTYSDDILSTRGGDTWALLEYASLRIPHIAANFFGLSVLLATLLMLTELGGRNELVAIWSTGVSQFRLFAMLAPVAVAIGSAHFMVNDRIIPVTAKALHEWGIGDYGKKKLSVRDGDPIWMRSGNDILRAISSNFEATELEDVIVFRRSPDGLLQEQIMAERAILADDRWVLEGVTIYYQGELPPNRVERLIYSASMRPATVGARSGDPEEMSVRDLRYFIENAGFGIRPTHVYTTWWNKRYATLTNALLMIAIAVPLAARFKRGGGMGIMFALGVALGFAFFIFEGIALTMGEIGLLPAWMAAWLPVFIFITAGGFMAFRNEAI